jgi:phosphatidate cytidylyltransferase
VLLTVLAAGVPGYAPGAAVAGPLGRLGWLAVGLTLAVLLAFVGELLRYEAPGPSTVRLALSLLAISYIGGLIGFLVQLRLLPDSAGMVSLVTLIATVKMSDSGQYFVGRAWGRHKLAPRVSPGKTWEGVAGGALFAIVGAWLAFWLSGHAASPLAIVTYALAIAAAGILGDLAESLLKRDAGVKDSSTWMPGFGGVLDMLDSLLAAAPIAYLFWAMGGLNV